MANGKTLNAVIEVNASPPPAAQTSLLLNCVELGSFAKQNSMYVRNRRQVASITKIKLLNAVIEVNAFPPPAAQTRQALATSS
jgi:hypothetical protein